jgi:uncharacterized repeat protein (TIGR03803 family)
LINARCACGLDGTLFRDSKGNLYGTTAYGGPTNNGTVWKLSSTGVETVLHSFISVDGGFPLAGVVRDGSGNLYGVTYYGGTFGERVIWKLTEQRVLTVLHSFNCSTDGCYPIGGVVRDSASGDLYGTAYYGGPTGPYGTVWRLNP